MGFGDIHAVNTGERFFSVMVMLIGTVFQGAIISKVSRNSSKITLFSLVGLFVVT